MVSQFEASSRFRPMVAREEVFGLRGGRMYCESFFCSLISSGEEVAGRLDAAHFLHCSTLARTFLFLLTTARQMKTKRILRIVVIVKEFVCCVP